MTPREEKRIQTINEQLAGDVRICLRVSSDDRSLRLAAFCEDLSRLAPRIQIMREALPADAPPGIGIGPSIDYHALPGGLELDPFLLAVLLEAQRPATSSAKTRGAPPHREDRPASLELYIAMQCPHCPAAVKQSVELVHSRSDIHLTVTDGALFPEMAAARKVQAVPTLVLDGKFRWTGPVSLEEILAVMDHRDPETLSSASLERMITEGAAGDIAAMMLDRGRVFDAFYDLLVHEAFSIRLGAMAAMESVAESSPQVAAQSIEPLWRRYPGADEAVQGDIIYLFGLIGSPEAKAHLKTLASGSCSPAIREALDDALDTL